jgi:c-di-GMP-binding flagellar brake protein YcgR
MSDSERNGRRKYARIKVSVPVEIRPDGGATVGAGGRRIRGVTADLSLGGCYIETIFPFPVGTNLDLQLSIETTVLISATVDTCDPQVGNGIKFVSMLPDDREVLKAFLEAAQQAQDAGSQGAGAS